MVPFLQNYFKELNVIKIKLRKNNIKYLRIITKKSGCKFLDTDIKYLKKERLILKKEK